MSKGDHPQSVELRARIIDLREKYFSAQSEKRKERLFDRAEKVYQRARQILPDFLRHQPVTSACPIAFLVSYPRSGNTFTHRILASLFETREYQAFDGSGPFTFSKLIYDPEEPRVRIVKDHVYRSEYLWDRSVIVVRDGRDACLSLAHFTFQEGSHALVKRGDLASFLRFTRDEYAFGDWMRSVRSALQARRLGAKIYIMKYEDLMASDEAVLGCVRFIDPSANFNISRVAELRQEIELRRTKMNHPSWGYGVTYDHSSYLHEWSRNRMGSNWRTSFDLEASRTFHEMGGTELLVELGYETNLDWWKKDHVEKNSQTFPG